MSPDPPVLPPGAVEAAGRVLRDNHPHYVLSDGYAADVLHAFLRALAAEPEPARQDFARFLHPEASPRQSSTDDRQQDWATFAEAFCAGWIAHREHGDVEDGEAFARILNEKFGTSGSERARLTFERMVGIDPPVDRCPFCEDDGRDVRGNYDGRILLGGRGLWRCPENAEHKWQDVSEKPSSKGAVLLRRDDKGGWRYA